MTMRAELRRPVVMGTYTIEELSSASRPPHVHWRCESASNYGMHVRSLASLSKSRCPKSRYIHDCSVSMGQLTRSGTATEREGRHLC